MVEVWKCKGMVRSLTCRALVYEVVNAQTRGPDPTAPLPLVPGHVQYRQGLRSINVPNGIILLCTGTKLPILTQSQGSTLKQCDHVQ